MSDHRSVTFDAGFGFARRLRDPEFRRFLADAGWTSGTHIIMTVDAEPVIDVINRVNVHEHKRTFIAIADEREQHGFRLLIAEVAKPKLFRRERVIKLGPGASVGMLYSALQPCGTYVPSAWSHELRFEKIETA